MNNKYFVIKKLYICHNIFVFCILFLNIYFFDDSKHLHPFSFHLAIIVFNVSFKKYQLE